MLRNQLFMAILISCIALGCIDCKQPEDKEEETKKIIYQLGKITFDAQNQVLKIDDQSKRLTSKESKILELLAKSKNNIVARDTLMKEIWGETDYFIGRSLDVFISKLRKHLKDEPKLKIETIPTVGVILSIEE